MSEVREGYKMTELGEIPVEWRIVELSEIADVKGGKRLPKGEQLVEYDTGLPYIRVSDMGEKGLKAESIMFVPEHVAPKISNYRIYKDEIYISVAGTLGLIGIVPEALDGANLTENADRICNIKTDNIYLNYYLKSQFIQNVISSVRTTSAQPKLALNQIKSFQILLPNRDEQKEIASILSTIDEQIDETEQLIIKTKELKKALMQQLLTKGIGHTEFKQTELGEIPSEWEEISLGEVFKLKSGENLPAKNVVLGDYPVYGGNGITSYHNKYMFEENKLVIGRVGALCGNVFISEKYSWITDNALYIENEIRDFDMKFMYYLLTKSNLNDFANKNAQPVISGQIIYSLKILLPSIKEQKKIASILSTVDEQIDIYEQEKAKYEELKKGLMQKLLTGQIRVKI